MKKIIFATGNKNKLKEVRDFFKDKNVEITKVKNNFNPNETGATFEENAYIKAFEAAKLMNEIAFGDDTGLEVDALEGRPGIYSSRYANGTDETKMDKLLRELSDVPVEKRTARFVCAISIVSPDGKELFKCIGIANGFIKDTKQGSQGFGYDPVFFIPEINKTMAELSTKEKNQLSHRGKALKQLENWLFNTDL
ncbi:MAG: RdgB/HAM1 family non-canonical purine NTP pyrophosphatase [Candidatus Gastranaerophilales bacterium]|nr:RdgB/HAM1 family non-canonical purine NTP pyrophosphatase [Candidatus Gastranaerophilales bacterium]